MKRDELLTHLAMDLASWPNENGFDEALRDVHDNWTVVRHQWVASAYAIDEDGERVSKDEWLAERERLINKPSWDEAHPDAKFLAQSSRGKWHFFTGGLVRTDGIGSWMGVGPGEWISPEGHGEIPGGHDWRQTLEGRPFHKLDDIPMKSEKHIGEDRVMMPGRDYVPACGDIDSESGRVTINKTSSVGCAWQREGVTGSGGSNDYWVVDVPDPKRLEPYQAECEDIIEALNMTFQEGEAFKAIWRKAADRMGNGKPGDTPLRNAEKVAHFGERMVAIERRLLKDDE